MSFSFQAAGTLAQARTQLESVPQGMGDPSQANAVKALLLAELTTWESTAVPYEDQEQGVFLEASGHHDGQTRTLTISMRPLWLRKPVAAEPAPEPEPEQPAAAEVPD
jgi:hypothetical protein